MEIDQFWENIFSEDTTRIRAAWGSLSQTERGAVRDLLERIAGDDERIEAQRLASRFALSAIAQIEHKSQLTQLTLPDLPDDALSFARNLAHETAQHLRATYGQMLAALKQDGTLVTASDIESDRRLSETILSRYPDHGVLSEEREHVYRGQEWCWVIDPIDGTTNFTWGFPTWGVLVALLHDGQPVLGVADFPMLDEQYSAARGRGAWLNGAPVHTLYVETDRASGEPIVQKSQIFVCCSRTLKHGRPNVPTKIRILGAAGYDLALLAKGACIGSLDMTVHMWDVAALWPILKEAHAIVKTNLVEGIFPLRSNVDYSEISFSVLGACSQPVMQMLEQQLNDRFSAKT
jgi:myo-inositol-1(or 4)-monophosphatase